MTLGYSRAAVVRFCAREDGEAFAHFGGVFQEMLFDNAATVVFERDADRPGHHRWHPELLPLAKETTRV